MAVLLPFVSKLKIVTKDLQVVELGKVMNHAQYRVVEEVEQRLDANERVRIYTLKARQVGISTITEAIIYSLAFLVNHLRGLVVAHQADSSEHLLSITDHYHETCWLRDVNPAKHRSIKHLSFEDSSSAVRIATARNLGAGRSRTIQALHLSELAFYDKPRELMTGLAQAVPRTAPSLIIGESTANGIGNYWYEEWYRAKAGESEFVPLFFPWWEHPEYVAEVLKISSNLGHLGDDERLVKQYLVSQSLTRDEVDSRLAWRRHTLANECQGDIGKLHQEYPTTEEEAFLATGNNVFPDDALATVYEEEPGVRGRLVERDNQRVEFVPDATGPLTIFKNPGDIAYARYVIGGDSTRGVKGDYACAQVLNRRSWEQVAVWHGHSDPASFAQEMILLGRYYNWALLCPESQGGGEVVVGWILASNYPYLWQRQKFEKMPGQVENTYGWWSGVRGKIEIVGHLLKAVIDRDKSGWGLTVHHHLTYKEMRAFEDKGGGQYGNSSEQGHDDTVTALALAVTITVYEALELAGGATPWVPGQEYATPTGRGKGRVGGSVVPIGAGVGNARVTDEMDDDDVVAGVPVALQRAVARATGGDDGGEWGGLEEW